MEIKCDWCKPANFPGFPGSLQASSNLPVSRLKSVKAPNLRPLGNTYRGLFFGDVKKENKKRSGFSALI